MATIPFSTTSAFNASKSTLDGPASNDTLSFSGSSSAVTIGDSLFTGFAPTNPIEAILLPSASTNRVSLGSAANESGFTSIFGGAQSDYISAEGYGTSGIVIYDLAGSNTLIGSAGDDLISGASSVANLIQGLGGKDTIIGGSGNDSLDGGAGEDKLEGKSGNDLYTVDSATDVVLELSNGGTDSVLAKVSGLTLAAQVEWLLLDSTIGSGTGNSLANTLVGNSAANTLDGGTGIDSLVGLGGNDYYIVDSLSDVVLEASMSGGTDSVEARLAGYTLAGGTEVLILANSISNGFGNSLANTLLGNSAANTLDGGVGNDSMIGGLGNDYYLIDSASDTIHEAAEEGRDSVIAQISGYTLAANTEWLLLASKASSGFGNSLANTLVGNSAANTLDGGLGADSLVGGSGSDLYLLDDAGDIVFESLSGGTDSVLSKVNHTLAANVEVLTLSGTAAEGFGNSLANTLIGNSLANTLDGATGADSMAGQGGNDYYLVDTLTDIVLEDSSGGTDSVLSKISGYTLGANLEVLILHGSIGSGSGNSLANTLIGNSAANTLDGGVGNDSMSGGLGNDYYVVDSLTDKISENSASGTDSVLSKISGFTLAENLEVLILDSSATSGTGNSLANTLVGNSLANTLDGGDGADSMTGSAGADFYIVDNAGDVVSETLPGEIDTVISSINYTLSANVERLTLTGTAASGAGNSLANTLTGNSLANTLDGGAGNDSLVGLAGNDYYIIDGLLDAVVEAANGGTDSVLAKFSGYSLASNVEVLLLDGNTAAGIGNSLNNSLIGNSAANSLSGGIGNDTLLGLAGNDFYIVDSTSDVVLEDASAGADSILAQVSGLTLAANVEVLILDGTLGSGTGNSLANTLLGNSVANTLDGGTGNDSLSGGMGNDLYIIDSALDVILEGTGTDVDSVRATTGAYTLAGNVEWLLFGQTMASGVGNSLSNTIVGNSLDNTLDGVSGSDSMVGGAGDDYYISNNSQNLILEEATGGNDTVASGVSFSLGANIEYLVLTGSAAVGVGNSANNTLLGNISSNTLDGGTGADSLAGGAGSDYYIIDNASDSIFESTGGGTDSVLSKISGYTLQNELEVLILSNSVAAGTGNTLANTLIGNSAGNTLDGGAGIDSLVGLAGNDYYIIDSLTDSVIEIGAAGTDSVLTKVSGYTLAANTEWLFLDATVAAGNGNSLANTLVGNSAANTLDGGAGNDSMAGLAGDDYYIVDSLTDVILESLSGGGTDSVLSRISGYTLAANTEWLVLASTISSGTGNLLANTLVGNSAANTLNGGGGIDSLAGLAGNDYYIIDNLSDVILEAASGGTDSVRSLISGYTLGAELEVLVLGDSVAAGTGNSAANTLVGNSAANTLDGGAGNDSLVGLAGNDYYIVDSLTDSVVELTGAGTDSVRAKISGYTLAANTEWLLLDSTLASGIGNSLANTLVGNSADNTLDGGLGNDSMSGLAGDDYYIVDSLTDVILESLTGGGTDSVLSKTSGYTLAGNTEWLLLASTISSGTGNSLANTLVGNSAANTLNGGAGIDSLVGLAGNDYYIIDNLSDEILEAASGGTDSVFATVSGLTLSDNLEVLILGGSAGVGSGNSLANTLVGNSASNTLNGGTGNDSLAGLAGNDYYIVDSLTDTILEASNEGTDSVLSQISGYTLATNAEWLILDATVASGIGNSLANTLVGNSAANTLNGGAGADSLSGGAGDDYYIIDSSADVVLESASSGTDSVQSSLASYTLTNHVEVLILSTGAIGTGNSLANTLVGNSLANTLWGATGSDSLSAGAGNDRLVGCAISANGGRNEKDTLTGGTGTDIFVLGDSVGAFYNDGNATNTGEEDFAYITDFTIGSDILRLKGTAEQYTLGSHTVAGLTTYQGLYLELGATDELIAIIQTTASTPTIGSLMANAEFV